MGVLWQTLRRCFTTTALSIEKNCDSLRLEFSLQSPNRECFERIFLFRDCAKRPLGVVARFTPKGGWGGIVATDMSGDNVLLM